MAESELLLTFAEVAVAFAGFASLVGILGRRTSSDHSLVLATRMRAMLVTSLLVTAFALLPLVISRYGGTGDSTWLISAVAMLVAVAGYMAWILITFRALGREISRNRFQRRIILPVLGATFLGLSVLCVLNVVLGSAALYISALMLLLAQGGFAFSLIVFSFLPRLPGKERAEGEE